MFKQLILIGLIFVSSISLSGQTNHEKLLLKEIISDPNLMVPEEIERNFDQLLVDWKSNMKASKLCTSNYDTNVDYPDSIYINRLYSLPTTMELVYNPVVKSYIDMYTGRMRSSVEYFLGKSDYFFPIFEQALDKYGLPLELKYLPVIESALNPTIVSRAGATGLWQFMIGTGKMYDLEINSLVDERRDPIRSTDAAARYLKDLFNIYGDWNLVIAAYNCGPGNVNKAIKRNGGQSDYWSIYPYLPRETRGYVPAFIAATYVMNYSSAHNICPFEYKYNTSTDTVVVNKYLHLGQIADVLNISIDEVRNLNPQFKNDIIPGEFKSYVVTLPSNLAADFSTRKNDIYSYKSNEFLAHRKVVEPSGNNITVTKIKYRVRKGDNLARIASKNGVTTKQLRRWNGLKSNNLRAGQILSINKTILKPKVSKPSETEVPSNQYYADNKKSVNLPDNNKAKYAEELSSSSAITNYLNKRSTSNIHNENTTDVINNEEMIDNQNLRKLNDLQTIYHKVRIGETVTLIAGKYNVEKEDIVKWNKLRSAVPKIGQRLVIHLPPKVEQIDNIAEESLDASADNSKLIALSNTKESDEIEGQQFREYGPSPSILPLIKPNERPDVVTVEARAKVSKQRIKSKPKMPTMYTVRKGDTLSEIVNKLGGKITTKDIMKVNKLTSDRLKIGQKLRIPR